MGRDDSRIGAAPTDKEVHRLEGSWGQLDPYQKEVLLPLRDAWPTMDTAQQEKWQLFAFHYRRKSSAEQRRMLARMQSWARLTPHLRAQARLGFLQGATKYDSKRRIERWATYRQIPPEQRPKMAAAGAPIPVPLASVRAPSGATTILMPQFFPLPLVAQVALSGTSAHGPEYSEAGRLEDPAAFASAGAQMAASAPLVEPQRMEEGLR